MLFHVKRPEKKRSACSLCPPTRCNLHTFTFVGVHSSAAFTLRFVSISRRRNRKRRATLIVTLGKCFSLNSTERGRESALRGACDQNNGIQRNVRGVVVALSPPLAWILSTLSIRQPAAGSVSVVWPGVSLPCLPGTRPQLGPGPEVWALSEPSCPSVM